MNAVSGYIAITGAVFCLIVVAHIARLIVEGPRLISEPSYIITTAIALGLAVWAGHLLWQRQRS